MWFYWIYKAVIAVQRRKEPLLTYTAPQKETGFKNEAKFFKKEGIKSTIKVVEKDTVIAPAYCLANNMFIMLSGTALQKKLALAYEGHNYNSYCDWKAVTMQIFCRHLFSKMEY